MSDFNSFQEKQFSYIRVTSDDIRTKPCSKCGDSDEMWVQGTRKGRKSMGIFAYPSLLPRKRSVCSLCVENSKMSKIKKKEFSKIFFKDCEVCNTLFVAKTSRARYCSRNCSTLKGNMVKYVRHELECQYCESKFTHNKFKKFCSHDCFRFSLRTIKEKECRTCHVTFNTTSKGSYCSERCKTTRLCTVCEKVHIPTIKRVCEGCKSCNQKKVSKPRKVYKKECPTCEEEFSTVYNYKEYCKNTHRPSVKEAKKLRKRTKKNAKLEVESWSDIADFKKGRPNSSYDLDHIIPLNHPDVCGLHNTWNFQWLSREDNNNKSNKFDGTMNNEGWKNE